LIHTDWAWLALVGGAVLVPGARGRRLGAGGLGALALALGALRAGGGPGRLPGDFAAVELALLLVGAAVLAAAAIPTARAGWRGSAAVALLAAGVLLLLSDLRALVQAATVGGSAAALGVVSGIAGLAWVAGGVVLRRWPPADAGRHGAIDRRWIACATAGVLLASVGPHVLLIFGGAVLAAVAVGAEALGRRGFSAAAVVAISVAALGTAAWLLAAIAGDQGLAVAALADLPLSPAAETLLAPLLLLAAWSVAGLWPLPRSPLTGLAGLAGLLLMVRVAAPALPEGLDHWRPLAYPVLGVGLWQAVVSRRWPAALIGGALFALIAGSAGGPVAAWCFGAGALGAGIGERLAGREATWLSCLAALAAGVGALPATAAGLQGEVVYTTLTVAGVAVLLAAGPDPEPSPRPQG
jgi:hypothetical protein